MKNKKIGQLKRQFLRMLANTGVSLIDEQKEILDIFCTTDQHLTVGDVERELHKRKKELPHQLIKSTLDMFCQYGIADKRTFKEGQVFYEHKHLQEHHDHMICVNCGKLVEFVDPKIENLQMEAAAKNKFHPLWHTLEIYGLCQSCFEKAKQTIPLAFAPIGERVRLLSIVGGYGIRRRLAELGLVPGIEFEVINNSGPFIIAVKGSRVAIGLGIARKVIVMPVEQSTQKTNSS